MALVKAYFGCITDSRKGRGNHLEKIVFIATHKKNTTLWIVEHVKDRTFEEMRREEAFAFLRRHSDYIIEGRIIG